MHSSGSGAVSSVAVVAFDAGWVGEVAVVGDESVEVVAPAVVEDPVACLGQWPVWCGAVFVAGVGDDGQFAEGSGPVGAVAEGLLAMVLAAQAHEVPFGGGSAQFGSLVIEGDDVVDLAVVGVDRAARVAAGAVAEPDAFGQGRADAYFNAASGVSSVPGWGSSSSNRTVASPPESSSSHSQSKLE